MNPYIEDARWRDFHTQFIVKVRQVLAQRLRGRYEVGTEEDVFIHEPSADERKRVAVGDASVATARNREGGVAASLRGEGEGVVRLERPLEVVLPVEPIEDKHRWVEIRDVEGNQVVTVIELLSPSNKEGDGRSQYLAKRQNLLRVANLVEIDLLRSGRRLPMVPEPVTAYCVMVGRHATWPRAEVWPASLREPLPRVPVPLLPPDADVSLDLQALLHAVYDEAAYGPRLYARELRPPLSEADAAWAEQVLREANLQASPADSSRK